MDGWMKGTERQGREEAGEKGRKEGRKEAWLGQQTCTSGSCGWRGLGTFAEGPESVF